MGENERRALLPDLSTVSLTDAEWEARAGDAGLVRIFDVTGRPATPTDDDLYDSVEAEIRADGRDAEADRFAEMRPVPATGEPPRDRFVDEPDPHRRGPPAADFELRVRFDGSGLGAASIRALVAGGRGTTGPWASVAWTADGPRISGRWSDVPEETFTRLIAATEAVFGTTPRLTPPPLLRKVRACLGGECAICHTPIANRGIRIGMGDPLIDEIRVHLLCADPEDVRSVIEFHRLTEHDLSEARRLERGTVRRCQACKGIIRKGSWRLTALYFDGALHLECAADHEPAGFRLALQLEPPNDFEDAAEWISKLQRC